jgi:hypothetical protein
MHRIICPVLLLTALFVASTATAQTPLYYGALLYRIPVDTAVPPLYPGQPSQVTTAYLWLDDLMRLEPENLIETYISSLTWNDTAQTIASNLYQIQDDNPLTYYNWDGYGITPHPYKGVCGQAEAAFLNQMQYMGGQCVRALLSSEIVADITVSDTVCKTNPIANIAKDAVLVNCVINDEIKGKWVPACPESPHAGKKGVSTLGFATPATPALPADTASTGTCLQFEYSPEWKKNADDDMSSTIGWWVKPGQEYIVFLYFTGVGYNNTNDYFSTYPVGSFGHCCGMYPIVDGIVQDPNDDLNLGAPNLPVAAWKAALRAKISALITP